MTLSRFSPLTRAWFDSSFPGPTAAQEATWAAVADGRDVLVVAPTGSGKTLAAFLWAIDRLITSGPAAEARCRVLYVSPLKALAVDVERNLRAPLTGIRNRAAVGGVEIPDVHVAVRSGDTPADARRAFARHPADILITTPESLYLLLTSAAREALRGVETVIVDEVHAVLSSKRGAHLAVSLERLDHLLGRRAQRIGLSATVRPVEEAARFLGGTAEVTVVSPPSTKTVQVTVSAAIPDMSEPDTDENQGTSIWPAVEERIAELVHSHRSTIVFANSRRLAERLCARLNDIALDKEWDDGNPLARAHHGSVAREQRVLIEDALKSGQLRCVVATSSLELGIDMGAVDLVIQVEPPPSVTSGLQRIGRAGHHVGAPSRGVLFPKHRGELLPAALTAERMSQQSIESSRYPRNPLDVLAQQIVAMVAQDDWSVDELGALVRRAAPFATLPQSALDAVLDMLSGRYPSTEFAELRPRLVWDRDNGTLSARPGARRLAVTSGGTIPDRGLYGVFMVGERANRVGELDEEMVYECREGEVFTLGSSSWRIEDITHDRVLVSPAPGQPGKLPFWHGDAPGRPVELGRALGVFTRELSRLDRDGVLSRLTAAGLDEWAAANVVDYLDEQRSATGALPDDRTLVVERFRDELGDWRLAVHTPFGARVHAPWALAMSARLRADRGLDAQTMHTDDGILLRLPDADDEPTAALALFEPAEIEQLLQAQLGNSALFASRFRECAARALLLPRRTPGKRTPLWQQRQRSAQLLAIASRYPQFPIVLEAVRECLQDVFDVAALSGLMRDVADRRVRVVEVETAVPSPYARSLLFGYVGAFLYEGDAPLAERRLQALALDPTLLAELLGEPDLRELLDPEAVAEVEAELQRLTAERQVHDREGVADLLRELGDLTTDEALARGATARWLAELEEARRALRVRVAGGERWVAAEDAGRLRDALGVPPPPGVPAAFLDPVADPVADLLARFARTRGPFTTAEAAARFGLGRAVAEAALHRLAGVGRLLRGEFRPAGAGEEWCDPEALRRIRRRSVARLRREAEPVPVGALPPFLADWQRVGAAAGSGADGLAAAVEALAGAAVPASALERLVLPVRVAGYRPPQLDEMTGAGEVVWAGAGALPGGDGWLVLAPAELAPFLLPPGDPEAVSTPVHRALLDALAAGGAQFFRALSDRVGSTNDTALLGALWDLVWAGWVTNDTLAPLRALLGGHRPARVPRADRRRRPYLPARSGPATGAGRWSLLPDREPDPTRRAHALTDVLLDRHGVLTRGAVSAEHVPGGWAAVYPVLRAAADAGRARRGYFVEGLGGAQFASPAAVDRLRDAAARLSAEPAGPPALLLSAADPANPYGAALPWPETTGHRPGRKAGAVVVLVGGAAVLYVERGGRSLLSFTDDPQVLQPAADALALSVRDGSLGRLAVERADGAAVFDTPLAGALRDAGFAATPRGLRLRG